MKQHVLYALLGMGVLAGCNKYDAAHPPDTATPPDALAPEGFTFNTAHSVNLTVRLLTNADQPLAGVPVNVFSADEKRTLLHTAFTDANGLLNASLNLPSRLDSVIIDPAYIGVMRNVTAAIRQHAVNVTLGGSNGYAGDVIPAPGSGNGRSTGVQTGRLAGQLGTTVISYHGSYDNSGRPTQLVTPDVLTPELLSYVNTSLPETKAVPSYHPEYLSNTAETNLNIEKTADVWITFVHEGAGYMNSLGYYKYPTHTPPQSLDQIDSIKLVIPNASLSGSGGAMRAGDKILLGRFEPGVSIGFVLLQNAWNNSTRTVNTNANKYFADDLLNNEKANFRRHTVLLHDSRHNLFLTGFEDVQRDNGASDQDFNDLVFYATSNPVEAISDRNVKPIDRPTDTDGDGISDVYDKFPTDPAKALVQYFPSDEVFGSLAFEDMWPNTGDYDMNDLVVDYRYTYIANGQNKAVEMLGEFAVRSVGAAMKNSFGVQLNLAPAKVSSVTGQRFTSNYIATAANGTETGQSKAVFFAFDDPQALINTAGMFVNVYNGRTHQVSDTARVRIQFTAPVSASELGVAPYNPFLVAGQRRGHEVHLAGSKPTDKADLKLFGTAKDNTIAAKNRYYLTQNNWPWAFSFVERFDYPTETSKITLAYLNFQQWAKSAGTTHSDWYQNKNGYRQSTLIYTR